VGIVLGAALVIAIGTHDYVLWAVLPVAVLPGIAVTGWAALTSTASVVVLGLVCVVALLATVVAGVPDSWLETAPGLDSPGAVRAAYVEHLRARATSPAAWIPGGAP